jgi:2-dehydro-3-deoxyphosphogluconate aldolase / (4S)-4-hydroxy-2-oxoglutarate aldolase
MNNLVDLILEKKIITIVRGTYGEDLKHLAQALYKGGIRFMEVTFDQKDPNCLQKTGDSIRMLNSLFEGEFYAGAGTVLTEQQVRVAHEAGAKYIISPNTNAKVITLTKELGMISIPGAMTPTEILQAHDLGADLVKLFPAATLGLRYVKDILAPISHVNIIATAGITEENFAEFLKLGLKGAGISGRLTDKKLIASGDWEEFTRRAQAFVAIAQQN